MRPGFRRITNVFKYQHQLTVSESFVLNRRITHAEVFEVRVVREG